MQPIDLRRTCRGAASPSRFTAAMRRNPYGTDSARLATLAERAHAVGGQIASLEGAAGAGGGPAPATVRILRDAEGHLREYLSHGAAGDEIAPQKDVWRYLWSLNSLPEELGEA